MIQMRWSEIRETYPKQWLVIESLKAHSEDDRRVLDRIAVVEVCPDGASDMQSYRRLHRQHPTLRTYGSRDLGDQGTMVDGSQEIKGIETDQDRQKHQATQATE